MVKTLLSRLGLDNLSIWKAQIVPATLVVGACLSMYAASQLVGPGLLTSLLAIAALFVVMITAFARVNDLNIGLQGGRWHTRRAGLIFVGAGAAAALLKLLEVPPSWNEAMLYIGFALTWLTTPNMPPWWRWIAGMETHNECARCAHGEGGL